MNNWRRLKKGELHIAGLNTGIVPAAVQRSGFVPVCTFGREDGTWGYTMKLLVPADSPIKDVAGLKGHKITLTRPDSNSGCKVLLALLRDEYDMQPDRDYTWGFSLGHEESIKGVAAKEFEAAPVASDILARMVEKNEVDPNAFRTIHESERFPPATIGIVYNLTPELRDAIRETLLAFRTARHRSRRRIRRRRDQARAGQLQARLGQRAAHRSTGGAMRKPKSS